MPWFLFSYTYIVHHKALCVRHKEIAEVYVYSRISIGQINKQHLFQAEEKCTLLLYIYYIYAIVFLYLVLLPPLCIAVPLLCIAVPPLCIAVPPLCIAVPLLCIAAADADAAYSAGGAERRSQEQCSSTAQQTCTTTEGRPQDQRPSLEAPHCRGCFVLTVPIPLHLLLLITPSPSTFTASPSTPSACQALHSQQWSNALCTGIYMYMYMYMQIYMYIHIVHVVCLTLLASFFLPSHL